MHQFAGVLLYMFVKTGKGLSLNMVPATRMLCVIQRLDTSQARRHVCGHDDGHLPGPVRDLRQARVAYARGQRCLGMPTLENITADI